MRITSDNYREARNLLFERGWTQGVLEDEDGSLCLLGACSVAATGKSFGYVSVGGGFHSHLMEELRQAAGMWGPFFNDEPGRTLSEVIEVLEKAEKLALIREES